MTARLTEARLREILDGCEGVQGGPWKLDKFACYVWAPSEKGGDFPLMDEPGEHGRVVELRGWGYYTGNGHGALGLDPDEAKNRQRLTGEHVARLDPDTVRDLCTLALSAIASRQAVADDLREANRQYLQEIADGAYGDGPFVRGRAREELAKLNSALAAPVRDETEPAKSNGADAPLTISVENGVLLSITVGADVLVNAVKYDPTLVAFDRHGESYEPEVTDVTKWLEELALSLRSEEEDGTTLVHRMLDKAAIEAIERGAEGIKTGEDLKDEARRALSQTRGETR